MEIYNENAYDLLDKKHIELPLDDYITASLLVIVIFYKLGFSFTRRRYE